MNGGSRGCVRSGRRECLPFAALLPRFTHACAGHPVRIWCRRREICSWPARTTRSPPDLAVPHAGHRDAAADSPGSSAPIHTARIARLQRRGHPPRAKSGPNPRRNALRLEAPLGPCNVLWRAHRHTAAAAGVWFLMPAGKHQAKALVRLRAKTTEIGKSQEDFDTFRTRPNVSSATRDLITRTLGRAVDRQPRHGEELRRPGADGRGGLRRRAVAADILAVTLTGDNLGGPEGKILDMLVKKYIDDATAYERRTRDERIEEVWSAGRRSSRRDRRRRRAGDPAPIEATAPHGGEGAEAQHGPHAAGAGRLDAELSAWAGRFRRWRSRSAVLQKRRID